jgi:hypothetical protein
MYFFYCGCVDFTHYKESITGKNQNIVDAMLGVDSSLAVVLHS